MTPPSTYTHNPNCQARVKLDLWHRHGTLYTINKASRFFLGGKIWGRRRGTNEERHDQSGCPSIFYEVEKKLGKNSRLKIYTLKKMSV